VGGQTTGDVMLKRPKTLPVDAYVRDVRRLFENDSVRTALLVDGERFAGALERDDVPADARDDDYARLYVRGERETVRPDLPVEAAVEKMRAAGTRRLVVLGDDGHTLRGLLCLTSDLETFCASG
jgi:CBS domain-containing protein